ncbi:ABC transporter permease [Ewingella americana]
MSHTLSLPDIQRRDPIFAWLGLILLAFALLPAWSLDYGLLESTSDEILAAYGWSGLNVSLLWLLLPIVLLFRPRQAQRLEARRRHQFDAAWSVFCALFMIVSATLVGRGLGYGSIGIFIALGAVCTLALSRLEWLGGDRFVLGSLICIIAMIGVFIIFPSIAIFIPMFTNDAGEFAPLAFMAVLGQSHILQVIWNSFLLSVAVGIGCTFFGLVLAIYTTRIAKRSAIIGRVFSILPIVTPPFIVGLGVTLMMGRSGYVTEFMANWFGLTNTNWLYGFTGIWLAQVLAFTPMAFMILDGAIKTIHPSLEEASYTLRASRWQTFHRVFLPLLKPALANAFLIVIVQSLADFSNPLVLGGNFDVLATQIYFYITRRAARLSGCQHPWGDFAGVLAAGVLRAVHVDWQTLLRHHFRQNFPWRRAAAAGDIGVGRDAAAGHLGRLQCPALRQHFLRQLHRQLGGGLHPDLRQLHQAVWSRF